LVIDSRYTSYTGCGILLYSASQKLLQLLGEEVGQDMLYASSHLNALSFCSYTNDIARKLYLQLQVVFNEIREVVVSPGYHAIRELHSAANDDVEQAPLLQYAGVDGAEEVVNPVLDLTRRITDILQENLSF
jgi:hypothetical protein